MKPVRGDIGLDLLLIVGGILLQLVRLCYFLVPILWVPRVIRTADAFAQKRGNRGDALLWRAGQQEMCAVGMVSAVIALIAFLQGDVVGFSIWMAVEIWAAIGAEEERLHMERVR